MITDKGKRAIGDNLARSLVTHIVVGIGTAVETSADERLQFEIERVPVATSYYSEDSSELFFKGTIPQNVSGVINEIGLVTSSFPAAMSRLVFSFENASEFWTGGTWVTTNSRVGSEALQITATTATLNNALLDLTQFDGDDLLQFAYFGVGGNLQVRLKNDASNYVSFTFPVLAGYNVHSIEVGALTKTGNPDLSNLPIAELIHTGSGGVTMDALRTEVNSPEQILVTRKKLAAPLVKAEGAGLDIECPMTISV